MLVGKWIRTDAASVVSFRNTKREDCCTCAGRYICGWPSEVIVEDQPAEDDEHGDFSSDAERLLGLYDPKPK